ncbi:CRISPR-associated protein Cas3 [Skermanella stibiiresistens SB22]|uniref:CRISPR-associated protein Cas3 n=1 Tax=Skermanella stibiiresistens SB22 TaxID=1385369 RepID=W9H4U0_9PROT|nr:CRISPR-associated helicase/endonuclease Cas3 [Skermanella stibiiresistens]EWY39806.1 CRISPR-associated protein Cas3 [Skermanella stibiiresistens SB22]
MDQNEHTVFAHSPPDGVEGEWEPLAEHLIKVGTLAAGCAKRMGHPEVAEALGLLHDIGKNHPDFQRYIRGKGVSVDHSTAGAVYAAKHCGAKVGRLMAFAIAGHHAGLANGLAMGGGLTPLTERLRDKPVPALPAGVELPALPATWQRISGYGGFSRAFLVRMLFACLIDADRLATEAYTAKAKGEPVDRGCAIPLATLRASLTSYLSGITQKLGTPPAPVNALRARVLDSVLEKATLPPGLFSLTVPTGGGKTLASLAFALKHAEVHAEEHDLRRVVYVIPFTSIVEQTAGEFRKALAPHDAVLEHHSNFDPKNFPSKGEDDEGKDGVHKLQLATENWDWPIVVTTAVQFFESLFSNRPSRCRKLHNIAGSVIVLDEAQTLPVKFLLPCLEAIRELATHYGCSIVLCTATQPAILKRLQFEQGLENVRELAPDPLALYQELKRVTLTRIKEPQTVDALAARLRTEPQILCIVNNRRHARDLHRAIQDQPGARLLTTSLCAAHRRAILADIKADLVEGRPVRLVATSLIEAGVDISFPVVLRAEAGIESIAQAAGRCNREGELAPELGKVLIFKPADHENHKPPPELSEFAKTAGLILDKHDDPLSLAAIEDYFKELYWLRTAHDGLDAAKILKSLDVTCKSLNFPFADIANAFQIIKDSQAPIIVPYKPAKDDIDKLLNDLNYVKRPGAIARALQQYIVQVPRDSRRKLTAAGAVRLIRCEEFGDQFAVLDNGHLYDDIEGLDWDDPTYMDAKSLICGG